MTSPVMEVPPHCKDCPAILMFANACFPKDACSTFSECVFDSIAVICSAYPFYLGLMVLVSPLIHRTARQCVVFSAIGLSALLCEILKKIYRLPRPDGNCSPNSFGFPSTHSAFIMTFFCIHLFELVFFHNRQFQTQFGYRYEKVLIFITTPIVLYSRYYLMYHSPIQILVGSIVGFCTALFAMIVLYIELRNPSTLFRQVLSFIKFKNDYLVIDRSYQPSEQKHKRS